MTDHHVGDRIGGEEYPRPSATPMPASTGVLERHVQTILVAGTMAILSWVLLSVLDIRERLTKFEERLATLSGQVNSGTDDRFRGQDWRREKSLLDERFDRLRVQVEKNADKVVDHEERIKFVERSSGMAVMGPKGK